MKKVLSLVLAIIMAFSVPFTLTVPAYAQQVKSIEFKPQSAIKVYENDKARGFIVNSLGGDWFNYLPEKIISDGDKLVLTKFDGSVEEYTYKTTISSVIGYDLHDFVNNDDEVLECYYGTDQSEYSKWGIGNHSFTISACGVKVTAEVEIVENPYTSFEYIPISSECYLENERGYGYWDYDSKENPFYHYIEPYFRNGDKIVLQNKNGSAEEYTCTITNGKPCFSDANGNLFNAAVYKKSNQYKTHWNIGANSYDVCTIDMKTNAGVEITKNSSCNHLKEWKVIAGKQQAKCKICEKVLFTLPYKDIMFYTDYCDYITYTSVYNSFINGTNPPEFTSFSPKTAITRAMLVTILYRMAGSPYDNGANPHETTPFTDITSTGVYYYNSACWALDNNITNQTTFKPNDNVTREQTAKFLYSYAQQKGTLGELYYKYTDLTDYPDVDKVHEWAVVPLKWANYNSMITGTQEGYLNPQGATQRIHATKILYWFGAICRIGNFSLK